MGLRAPPGWPPQVLGRAGGAVVSFSSVAAQPWGCRRLAQGPSRSQTVLRATGSPSPETDARPAGHRTLPAPGPSAWPDQSAPTLCSPDFRDSLVSVCYVDSLTVLSWRRFREKGVEGGVCGCNWQGDGTGVLSDGLPHGERVPF